MFCLILTRSNHVRLSRRNRCHLVVELIEDAFVHSSTLCESGVG